MPVVLDVWDHVAARFGGIGPSAATLAGAIESSSPWRSELLAVCNTDESEWHRDIPPKVRIVRQQGLRPSADIRLRTSLRDAIFESSVCHVHGIWSAPSLAVCGLAKNLGRPLVCSVHGMLEKWELSNKSTKKRVYSALFQRPSLAKSSCLRALSEQEAIEYRDFGLRNPIAVVPNGVGPLAREDPSDFLSDHPELVGKRITLFMSRLHRKKGILELVRAWPAVQKRFQDSHLLVAGGDCEGTEASARELAAELRVQRSVTFCGVLNGSLKHAALSTATVFCLPSFSEGMSMAVLEALSIGLPVVVTPACNVGGINEAQAGFVTTAEPAKLAQSLCEALSLSSSQWQSMSASAQSLAKTRYGWPQIAANMCAVYEWLLGGPKPDCVLD
jgi:glycosyltransferase involved in cell wall biosynthesis